MLKKYLTSLLIVVLIFSLAACGQVQKIIDNIDAAKTVSKFATAMANATTNNTDDLESFMSPEKNIEFSLTGDLSQTQAQLQAEGTTINESHTANSVTDFINWFTETIIPKYSLTGWKWSSKNVNNGIVTASGTVDLTYNGQPYDDIGVSVEFKLHKFNGEWYIYYIKIILGN